MFKKLLLTVILFVSYNINAVILRNGVDVPLQVVNRIYNKLQNLYQDNNDGCAIINLLLISCYPEFNRNINNYLQHIRTNPRLYYRNEADCIERLIRRAIELELCDDDGILDIITEHILKCSVICVRQGYYIPIFMFLRSPIAWSNYFSFDYWMGNESPLKDTNRWYMVAALAATTTAGLSYFKYRQKQREKIEQQNRAIGEALASLNQE